jgi:hypothetical protein
MSQTRKSKPANPSTKGRLAWDAMRGCYKLKGKTLGVGEKIRHPSRPELVYVVCRRMGEWGFYLHAGTGHGFQRLSTLAKSGLHVERIVDAANS